MIYALAILLSFGCACFGYLYMRSGRRKDYRQAFWRKGLAGLCFVAAGVCLTTVCGDKRFAQFVVAGLCFGLLGDQLLALRFENEKRHDLMFALGALAFSVGHVWYVAALCGRVSGLVRPALPLFVLGFAASALYARLRRIEPGRYRLAALGYIGLVVFMAAMACSLAVRSFSAGTLLFAAGGISFTVSDNLLCARSFGGAKGPAVNNAIHISYYAAQLLFAWSLACL